MWKNRWLLEKTEGFEWDVGNIKECEEVFFSQPLILFEDEKHSKSEKRYGVFGKSNSGRELTIFFTVRKNKIRIISARPQSRKERNFYEKN